ncbi:protein of unknown function [Streptomyces sp. KY75]|nr:protein of unknown function [Streptomyces sp. KY70]CAD5982119.1 protein of unknown function [Streptomyces sp. KY75]
MRVLVARVDLQLRDHLTAQGVLGDHAADGLLDGLLGVLREKLVVAHRTETAREARVAVRHLLGLLVARQVNLVGVDDDDEVAHVHVGGVDRLVLTSEEVRSRGGQTAQDDVLSVDDVPLARHISGLGAVRTHFVAFASSVDEVQTTHGTPEAIMQLGLTLPGHRPYASHW